MAEHRAAVNALHALFLVKGDSEGASDEDESGLGGMWRRNKNREGKSTLRLPTESHGQWAIESGRVGKGLDFQGTGWGGAEVVVESGKRAII